MAKRAYRIRLSSRLNAPAEVVWAHATSLAGVNAELAPIRMHGPRGALIDASVPLGRPLGRGLVTLFGVIPLDFHELTLIDLVPGTSFHERSRTALEAVWVHKRKIVPDGEGACEVVDDVSFAPRLFGAVVGRVVPRVFSRRHAFLRKKFGSSEPAERVVVESLTPEL